MSNDLVTINDNQNALAMFNPLQDLSGLSTIAKIRPTNLTLVQNTTKDPKSARPGQILDELSNTAYDSLTVVPLRVSMTRVMFPPGSGLGSEPICRSSDGIVPAEGVQLKQHHECKTCPKAQWFNKKRPACQEKLRMLVIVKETGLPRWVTFGGMSIRPLKDFLSQVQQDRAILYKKEGLVLSLHDYFFTLKLDRISNTKGVFYMARFDDVTRVSNPGEFGPLFEEYVVKRIQEQEEIEAAEAAAEADEVVTSTVGDVVTGEIVDV